MKFVNKVWGKEKIIVNNSDYCGKILYLKEGYRSSKHYHKVKRETFYVLEGTVFVELFGYNNHILKEGMSVDVIRNQLHRFTGLTEAKIIEFSTHDERKDSYRTTDSEKMPEEEFKKMRGRLI